jgi:ABC-type glycerol-3-phosphate transport system permease component
MQAPPTTDAGGWRPNKAAILAASHYVSAVAVVLVWLFPLVWILLTSLKNRPDIFSRTPLLLFAPTLNNYFEVASRREFVEGLVNSLKTASLTTILAVAIGVFAAYPLSRLQFRSRDQILLWVLSLRMMPTVAIVVPFYLILYRLGLLDTLAGLVCVYLSLCFPPRSGCWSDFFLTCRGSLMTQRSLTAAAIFSRCCESTSRYCAPRWRSSPFSHLFSPGTN